jgi:hypothetical protein
VFLWELIPSHLITYLIGVCLSRGWGYYISDKMRRIFIPRDIQGSPARGRLLEIYPESSKVFFLFYSSTTNDSDLISRTSVSLGGRFFFFFFFFSFGSLPSRSVSGDNTRENTKASSASRRLSRRLRLVLVDCGPVILPRVSRSCFSSSYNDTIRRSSPCCCLDSTFQDVAAFKRALGRL